MTNESAINRKGEGNNPSTITVSRRRPSTKSFFSRATFFQGFLFALALGLLAFALTGGERPFVRHSRIARGTVGISPESKRREAKIGIHKDRFGKGGVGHHKQQTHAPIKQGDPAVHGLLSAASQGLALSSDPLIKTVALRGGHHYLTLKNEENRDVLFLVDSGATTLTMPTKWMDSFYSQWRNHAVQVPIDLADGRTIRAYKTVMPRLRIGASVLKNVAVTFCDDCSPLLGKSVLKDFLMTVEPRRGLEIMILRRVFDDGK